MMEQTARKSRLLAKLFTSAVTLHDSGDTAQG
jgi:hypothetical protein